MNTVLISTRNQHKVQEIRSIFPSNFVLLSLAEFPGAPEVIEDGDTFAANAAKKAMTLASWIHSKGTEIKSSQSSRWIEPPGESLKSPNPGSRLIDVGFPSSSGMSRSISSPQKLFILADDSGLEVDALNGAPGVHSARFSVIDQPERSGNAPDQDNNAKLLRLLSGVPIEKRTARFRCVLAWVEAGEKPQPKFFEGSCEGRIDLQASGSKGFGYDPLFVPNGYALSFAELGDEIKNEISHRAEALRKLASYLGRV